MTQSTGSHQELKNTGYELFILLISILSIFNWMVILIPSVDPIVKGVVGIIDIFITLIFIGDFLYRFFTAESKSQYFFRNWGWADLLASMPMQQLKIFRMFRVVKVIHLLREFGFRHMIKEVIYNRASSALYITVFLVILVLEFGGIAMVYIEAPAPTANITTSADAVWWAFVTITTVGYGDFYPVTNTGRLIGMLVMGLGVGLFGVLTGFLANAFLSPQKEKPISSQMGSDAAELIGEFRKLLEDQAQANAALKARLSDLEALLETSAS